MGALLFRNSIPVFTLFDLPLISFSELISLDPSSGVLPAGCSQNVSINFVAKLEHAGVHIFTLESPDAPAQYLSVKVRAEEPKVAKQHWYY